jgi:hypothetical protein
VLFQIRFFELRPVGQEESEDLPRPWIRLRMAVVIRATIVGIVL